VSLDAHFDRMTSCETRDDLFAVASDAIARTVGTDGVRVGEFTMSPRVGYVVLNHTTGPDFSPSLVASPLQNPIIAHYYQTRSTGPVSMEDLLPGRAWTDHPLYNEVYRPLRLRSHIATALRVNGSVMNSISLYRGGQDFTTNERSLLTQFSAVIRSVWRRLDDITFMAAVIGDIDEDPWDDVEIILSLGETPCREVYMSSAARRVLRGAPELKEQIRKRLVQGAPRPSAVSTHSELHTDDGRCYSLRTVATPIGVVARLKRLPVMGDSRPSVVTTKPSPATSLTQREVSVLRLLAAGCTASRIARTLGLSEKTVRKHLQNIYSKLDCHDRLLAVREAHRIGVL
jgi:DNA-binding NarL/FixJ family response regulator